MIALAQGLDYSFGFNQLHSLPLPFHRVADGALEKGGA
jgi:hypothetical protein